MIYLFLLVIMGVLVSLGVLNVGFAVFVALSPFLFVAGVACLFFALAWSEDRAYARSRRLRLTRKDGERNREV